MRQKKINGTIYVTSNKSEKAPPTIRPKPQKERHTRYCNYTKLQAILPEHRDIFKL